MKNAWVLAFLNYATTPSRNIQGNINPLGAAGLTPHQSRPRTRRYSEATPRTIFPGKVGSVANTSPRRKEFMVLSQIIEL